MNYREIIESRYNRESWQRLLHDIFRSGTNFWIKPIPINANSPIAVSSLQLGTITLADDNKIAVYEIKLSDNVDMQSNRVGIRNLLHSDWKMKGCVGAFMFCYRDNESVLRFSYVSSVIKFNKDGGLEREETDTKRFTYLLGEGHRSRTAIKQFEELKNSGLLLKDLTKAFSVEALSDRFFKDYKGIYDDIIEFVTGKRVMKISNKYEEKVIKAPNAAIMSEFRCFDNPEKAVRDYVKRLMGRIVFLQFIQKKGWLGVPADSEWGEGDKEFLQNLYDRSDKKDNFIDIVLEALFNDINTKRENDIANPILGKGIKIPYLNGGLFERDKADKCAFRLPKSQMDKLFNFFSSYNFTIDENDPDDAEIGVDPEMLGRIFENLLEDNKDKGAFYTPKEIVQYMCRESLIAYLETGREESDKEVIRQFVTTNDVSLLNSSLKEDIDNKLINVKICDPAIGSGAFPMGLLKELYACRSAIEGLDDDNAAEIKKHIIQNNIYGVDIEKGAVDIARLRFWLSIIVDEKTPHALPNMDFKIMQGNSLIPTFDGKYVNLEDKTRHINSRKINDRKKELYAKQREFYFADGDTKSQLLVDIKVLILEIVSLQMDYEYLLEIQNSAQTINLFTQKVNKEIKIDDEKRRIVGMCTRLQAELKSPSKSLEERAAIQIPFFDWKIMFSDVFNSDGRNGFDIVIGNPPYIKEYENRAAFDGFRETSPYYLGKMDIWYGFACHGVDMLNNDGILCFIAQNNWTTSAGAKKLRNKIISDAQIIQLVDFNTYMAFQDASIQTMVMLFRRNNFDNQYTFDYRRLSQNATKNNMIEIFSNVRNEYTNYLTPTINRKEDTDKLLTFSNNDALLNTILRDCQYLVEEELAQGIVFPQDFLKAKYAEQLGLAPGAGVFGLSNEELTQLGLNENEKSLIKPYFTSEQICKYFTTPTNKLWMIYTNSKFKNPHSLDNYPSIKRHLDKFTTIITSDNKPYGLHRSRDEWFFKGEKVIVQRKCPERPCFSYSDFDCYVTQTYYVIKTNKFNLKFLTGLLNSTLIAFWLKNRGKMQGANYQLDKEPLMQIPIRYDNIALQEQIAECVSRILESKSHNLDADISSIERRIDSLVYELYHIDPETIAMIEKEI